MKGGSPPAECECDRRRDGSTASSFAGHAVRLENIAKGKPNYARQIKKFTGHSVRRDKNQIIHNNKKLSQHESQSDSGSHKTQS